MRKLRANRRGPLGRAATMIEFTLVIPVFLFMMLFSVDMGMLMLTSGAMNDTAFSSARAGAQAGGGGYNPATGYNACPSNGTCGPGGISFDTAQDGVEQMPVSDTLWTYQPGAFQITSGAVCRTSGADSYVTVEMPYKMRLFTPGLGAMLKVMGSGDGSGRVSLTAVGVARCELYRAG